MISRILNNKFGFISIAMAGAIALSGCASKSKTKDAGSAAGAGSDYNYKDAAKGGIGLGLLERIHFDFDKSEIGPSAVETLKKNAARMKSSNSMRVLVEGFCDERGTNEYNVALGERRARATLNYLVSLGVARNRLEMKSWGEERPLNPAHNDAAWAENRRAEFVILEK